MHIVQFGKIKCHSDKTLFDKLIYYKASINITYIVSQFRPMTDLHVQ